MGEVYLVNDTVIGRQVAIKIMRADPASYPDTESIKDAVRLFKREAQAIAKLEHPNILPLFDFGEEKRDTSVFTYMVMPNCQEGSLADWLKRHRPGQPLPLDEVIYFVAQAAEALQYAHEHGVIHQDVKPSNFLLRTHASGQLLPDLLLADFGIARTGSGVTITTISAGPRGTPRYMPPEQWEGKPVPASDQYALAVMVYQLLTCKYPFAGDQMIQLMYQHLQNTPEPPSKWNPAISRRVDAVILHALSKKPEERFPSVKEFVQALRQALARDQPAHFRQNQAEQAFERRSSETSYDTSAPTLSAQETPTEATYDASLPTVPPRAYPAQAPLVLPANASFSPPAAATQAGQPTPAYAPARPTPPFSQQPVRSAANAPVASPPAWAATGSARPLPQSAKAPARGKAALIISLLLLVVLAGAGGAYYTFLFKPSQQNNLHKNVQKQPTATVDSRSNPYTSSMPTLSFADPLSQPNMWQSLPYDQLTDGFCLFQQAAYHASANKIHVYTLCPAASQQPSAGDMTFEVQMQILHGDCGGVLFRGDYQQGDFYYFAVCFDGHHYLATYKHFALLQAIQLQPSILPALQADSHATVTVGIVAQGNTLTFYLNGQQVDQVTDSTYTSGRTALFCFAINNPTEIIFSHARLWTA